MRLSNYIYCTLTPPVCCCGTHGYAVQTNAPNSYCHTHFALMHSKANICCVQCTQRARTVMIKLCCLIRASKKGKHANLGSKTVVLFLHLLSLVSTILHEKPSELSNRWHVTLSLWLSQCSADEAFDSSGNNLGLDGLSNLFIETVQSQQTYLYVHLVSLNVQLRLSRTTSTMEQ